MGIGYLGIFFLVSFGASAVGAICGIGGGVFIKPLLDALGVMGVDAISFLSGTTVLAMSAYTVWRRMADSGGTWRRELTREIPLAFGAAMGGILGRDLFRAGAAYMGGGDGIGGVQALCLFLVTMGTLVYHYRRRHITALRIEALPVKVAIGGGLGLMSAFLGIGGGPINLVVLSYCFSLDAKAAAGASLFIIFFSQIASLLRSLLGGGIPSFPWEALVLMVLGGVVGGMVGRRLYKHMPEAAIARLFSVLTLGIMGLCVYNMCKFLF